MRTNPICSVLLAASCLTGMPPGTAQDKAPATTVPPAPNTSGAGQVAINEATSPLDLAKAALAAQGGDKFRSMKSLVLKGSADLYAPNQTQALPAEFVLVTAGERMRLEIQSAIFTFRQIFDGEQMYTSMPGFDLPSPNRFGLPVLPKVEMTGYKVTALPDRKKLRAFRITDPDGVFTDYFVDPGTGRVMSYESTYNGLKFGVEHKSLREVNGVLVPFSFVQRFATPQGVFLRNSK